MSTTTDAATIADQVRAALLATPALADQALSRRYKVGRAFVAQLREELASGFVCPHCERPGIESLKREGMCKRCSVACDAPPALRAPTPPPPVVARPAPPPPVVVAAPAPPPREPPPPPPAPPAVVDEAALRAEALSELDAKLDRLADGIARFAQRGDHVGVYAARRRWLQVRYLHFQLRRAA
jgi:hypothetical protein